MISDSRKREIFYNHVRTIAFLFFYNKLSFSEFLDYMYQCSDALGFDQGRPEDEPTLEELKEFDDWCNNIERGRGNEKETL